MLPTNPLLNATAPAGPHLPTALLRQYAAGTLASAAQHRVEAHTLACPRCADVLEGLLQTPPATTDQALAQLQQRLRKRVQAAPTRPVLAPRQHRWLAPQLAAAAALLLGLVAGGWWAWQQRHATTASSIAVTQPARAAPSVAATTAPSRLATPAATSSSASPETLLIAGRPPSQQRAQARGWAGHRLAPRYPTAARASAGTTTTASAAIPSETAPAPIDPAPVASRATIALPDSAGLAGHVVGLALHSSPSAARVRTTAMPVAAGLAPMPVGGTAALREQLRREAAEFVPEAPEQRLAGTVQLRVTIGADGKPEKISVLRGLRADYDAEAQRLVCEGPAWVPGISSGRRAAQTVDLAVPF